MKVSCPSCDTRFSISAAALGPQGRKVRCARCGHKWFVEVPLPDDDIPLEMPPAPTVRERETLAANMFAGGDTPMEASGGGLDLAGLDLDNLGGVSKASAEDPFAKISELMMSSAPEPIPDIFASPVAKPAQRRKGAAGLWLLLVILLLACAASSLYLFQDRVIDRWPALARYYEEIGARNEVVGAGLTFRNYNSERLVQDNNEVLIVRGVIANVTDQPREIPLLRLALYNNQTLLQEKRISPPQTTLDAHGTVGFRITLEQPDANATRFEVTFTTPLPPGTN